MADSRTETERSGILAALSAFLLWGFSPIYFRAVGAAPALEILAHRVVWSLLLCLLLLLLQRRLTELTGLFRNGRIMLTLSASSILVSVNWLGFIWAVNNERALEASMGYFILPIVMVLLGRLFLQEHLNRNQAFALLLVILGVLNLIIGAQQFPWIALLLASSFGCYGLVRKQVPVGPLTGLAMECLMLSPVALIYLLTLHARSDLVFGSLGAGFDTLLICSALMTALPLLLFTSATTKLRLGTVGLLQYLNPSCQFLLAVFLFDEPFTAAHLLTFLLIWSGLIWFTLDSRRRPLQTPG